MRYQLTVQVSSSVLFAEQANNITSAAEAPRQACAGSTCSSCNAGLEAEYLVGQMDEVCDSTAAKA